MISARNCHNLEWSRSYLELPDAFRVPFKDRTDDFADKERLVPRPGFIGDPQLTEELELLGHTDPDQVYLAATRRFLELMYRADTFKAEQGLAAMACQRGDLVLLNHDVIDSVHQSGRVDRVTGDLVELDHPGTMEEGKDYAVRFRRPDLTSFTRRLVTRPGEHRLVRLLPEVDAAAPEADFAFAFGELDHEVEEVIVSRIERGDNFGGTIYMLPHAPEIDEQLALVTPPPWDGRVGAPADPSTDPPAVPLPTIVSGRAALVDGDALSGDASVVNITLSPGGGSTVAVGSYSVRHRLQAAEGDPDNPWTTVAVPAATAFLHVTGYDAGDVIEVEAEAISRASVASAWSTLAAHTVLSAAVEAPGSPVDLVVTLSVSDAVISWRNPNDVSVAAARVWRAPSGGDFGTATDVSGPIYSGPNARLTRNDSPGSGSWDYFVTAESAGGIASAPAGPETITVP
jgi:hypothetical protein